MDAEKTPARIAYEAYHRECYETEPDWEHADQSAWEAAANAVMEADRNGDFDAT